MALVVSDAASALLNWLQTHADAAEIRALVYGAATNILEAGDIRAEEIQENYAARRAANETGKVLALTVHDAGEERRASWSYSQFVVVRIFDWRRGYRNIRAVRDQIKHRFKDDELTLEDIGARGQGVLQLLYGGRTGYRLFSEYLVEFEAMTFTASLEMEED